MSKVLICFKFCRKMPAAPGKQPLMRLGSPAGGSDPVSKQNCVVRDELALHMTRVPALWGEEEEEEEEAL